MTQLYEYNSGDSALQCMRNSAAVKEDYVDGFSDLIAFEKNIRSNALFTTTVPFISTSSLTPAGPVAVDLYNSRVLSFDTAAPNRLRETPDGINFTILFNADDGEAHPNLHDWYAVIPGSKVCRAMQLSANSALVSYGTFGGAYSEGSPQAKLFITTDNYSSFTEVLADDAGMITLADRRGDMILATVYHDKGGNDSGLSQRVYLSEDAGLTWRLIASEDHSEEPDVGSEGIHVHYAQFIDDDSILVTYGDGIFSKVRKFSRPSPDTGEWDIDYTVLDGVYQTSRFGIYDGIAYLRREGMDRQLCEVVTLDVATGVVDSTRLSIPAENTNTYLLNPTTPTSKGNHVVKHLGVYYTNGHAFGADTEGGGLYASIDGQNWACIYRDIKGVRHLTGVLGSDLICEIFDAAGDTRMGFIPLVTGIAKDAIIVEKGQMNVVGEFLGNETVGDQFDDITGDATLTILPVNERLNESHVGMKMVASDEGAGNPGNWNFHSEGGKTDPTTLAPVQMLQPLLNEYTVLSCDVKGIGFESLGGEITSDNVKRYQLSAQGVNPPVSVHVAPIGNNWSRVWVSGKCTGTPITTTQLTALLSNIYTPELVAGLEIHIDNLQMYHDAERSDTRSFIPLLVSGTDMIEKADDYYTAPLTGLGASWSVTFEWLPHNGDFSYPYDASWPTLPIATIRGSGGSYIELRWNRNDFGVGNGRMFELYDGTTTVPLGNAAEMSWLHNDLLKFGITSDGTTTILYCFNPENKSFHGSVILDASGAAIIDLPTQIVLGADEAETVIGTGSFANIRGFNTVLSAGEVATIFDSVQELLPTITDHMLQINGKDFYESVLL